MSNRAINYVADLTGMMPNEKLVLFQLAAAHNGRTGQCNPSPSRIARLTGLPLYQVNRILTGLTNSGVIRRIAHHFEFNLPANDNHQPVPADYWPSEAAINALITDFPQHDFSLQEAVNDFIQYAHRTNLTCDPFDLDRTFVANISGILNARRPGQVAINRDAERERSASVGALLSGSR